MNWYARLIGNHPLANILFALVLVLGVVSYLKMPREQDPEINFNWVAVTTVIPGASAEDVEKLVTRPLEDAVKNVTDIRFVSSSSRENVSSLLVRFRDIDGRTFDKRVNDLRREVQNAASTELPTEARDPIVLEITTSNGFPTAMVMLTGQANDENLRAEARRVREDLERIGGVDRVFANGLRDPELLVEFSPALAQGRGVTPSDISDSVGAWFRDTFAGKRRAGDEDWLVRVLGQDADPDFLARVNVASARDPRHVVPLDAMAEVSRARARAERLVTQDGRPAVMMAVTKKSYTNTIELVQRVEAYIAERNTLLAPTGLQLSLLDDQTVPTRQAIQIMETNAALGLMIVLAISWLFLGSRIAVLVGLGIPFALAGTFAILYASGNTLNITVLLGVVIALGMLVDDAVVVVEAIYYRVQRGQDVLGAAVAGLREVIAPVTASVLTTIAAFLPLMLLPGIVGKFMFVIPFVVTVALFISLIEAYWMLPSHVVGINVNFERKSRLQQRRERFTHWLRVKYARLLIQVLRRPKLSMGAALLLMGLAVAAVGAGLVRVQFFAFDPLRIIYVNVDMPAATPLDLTLEKVEAAEAVARKYLRPDEARGIASLAGVKFTDTEPLYGDPYGQVVVALNPRTDGMRDVQEIVEAMRQEAESLPGPGTVTFTLLSGGPPLSKAIKVRARGDDYEELRAAADDIRRIVSAAPGTRDVSDDDVPGRPELVIELDREAVRTAGLNPAQVARWIRLNVDGEIVAEMRDAGEKVEVRVRARQSSTDDIARLLDYPIALPGGGVTTLDALTRFETRVGKGIIKRYNLRRAITVESDLDKEMTNAVVVNDIIKAEWAKVQAKYPNVSLDFSGELDDIQESLDAMPLLFFMGVGVIYLILATQFRSYWQPLMILVTVPLAFTGVVLGLLVSRVPLSLFTLYGVIALTGIAVNSAIVLISAANERRRAGMSVLHAAVYAGRRRIVPIIITTVTTIGGLFSLAFGIGGKSLLWSPVASSIVWGLGFASMLTLFVIPLLYWTFMRPKTGRVMTFARRLRFGAGT